MQTRSRPTLCFVLALAAVPTTVRAEVTEAFSQTYTLAPAGTVSLANANGTARFVAAPEGSHELRVEGTKRGETAEDLQAVTVETDAGPNAVRVTTRYAKDGSRSRKGSVDYMVTVPRGAKLEGVRLTNGSLTLEGLTTAGVEANCVNGTLVVRDLAASGAITLGDVNGGLEVSLRALPSAGQPVEIKNVNGYVRLSLPPGAGVDLSAKTVNGRIQNDIGLPEEGKNLVGHTLEGRIGNAGTPVRLSTVNGGIKIMTEP